MTDPKADIINRGGIMELRRSGQSCALIPMRINPPQKAHVTFIKDWVLHIVDAAVIVICSSNKKGTERYPLTAVLREKMLGLSLKLAGVDMSRITFVHVEDYPDNYAWCKDIMTLAEMFDVTHFVTGNDDVIGLYREYGMDKLMVLMNPETDMPLMYKSNYHATDLRNAIRDGDYDLFYEIAALGTKLNMGGGFGFTEILAAMENRGTRFVPGRQATDMVLLITDKDTGIVHLLCGRRVMTKEDFPGRLALPGGGVDKFKNAMDESVRECEDETGIPVEIKDRYLEPAHVRVAGRYITELHDLGLFGSEDVTLAGNQGGSSHAFAAHIHARVADLRPLIKAESDLEDVDPRPLSDVRAEGLAFQQNEMVDKAVGKLL